jgi:branched-chain amino acid transport system ATP-binding protein
MSPILETNDLSKSFGAVAAASGVSVSVAEGEVIGIIGANGAGKTTFVNLVTGYLKPSSGTIRFRGQDITHLQPRLITRLGICRSFQVAQLFPEMTASQNLLLAAAIAKEERLGRVRPLASPERVATAAEMLTRYGIADYRDARVATLRQGVRKLLDIAMAVSSNPALLLLDEPTSGVSAEEKFGLMDRVMAPLEGKTVLFVEHDMEIVERYARRVLAFYDGRVIADARPAEVLADADVRKFVVGREMHRDLPGPWGQ